jgi:hypothetical protein
MAAIGISNGISRFGAQGPSNGMAPAGNNTQRDPNATPWYASGPFWVLMFLAIGYLMVTQTLKGGG